MRAKTTTCPKGHPYEGDNLYSYTITTPFGKVETRKVCKACRNEKRQKQRKEVAKKVQKEINHGRTKE